MVSYRTHNAYETKFGRKTQVLHNNCYTPDVYAVESYLKHQGQKFVKRSFDANCYVLLTRMMDSHDVSQGRGEYPEVLSTIKVPTLIIGIASDVLYPLHEQELLARFLGNCRGFHTIDSDEGHDGFLLAQAEVAAHLTRFLQQIEEAFNLAESRLILTQTREQLAALQCRIEE